MESIFILSLKLNCFYIGLATNINYEIDRLKNSSNLHIFLRMGIKNLIYSARYSEDEIKNCINRYGIKKLYSYNIDLKKYLPEKNYQKRKSFVNPFRVVKLWLDENPGEEIGPCEDSLETIACDGIETVNSAFESPISSPCILQNTHYNIKRVLKCAESLPDPSLMVTQPVTQPTSLQNITFVSPTIQIGKRKYKAKNYEFVYGLINNGKKPRENIIEPQNEIRLMISRIRENFIPGLDDRYKDRKDYCARCGFNDHKTHQCFSSVSIDGKFLW